MTDAPPWRQPRTLADFGGLDALKPAERKLLAGRDTGLVVVIGDGTLPPADAPDDVRVRASFLRWLILGGEGAEGQTHEKGVRVAGAFVESDGPAEAETQGLDLEGCTVGHDIVLFDCRFEDAPLLRSARVQGVYLNGSTLPGFVADRMTTTGGVFLCDGFESKGEIRLLGARIGGNLDCTDATLRNVRGDTLNADGLETTGSVFLYGGFKSDGAIRLLSARIGGDLDCDGAKLRNPEGDTLRADGMDTIGNVFLRGIVSSGHTRLLGARIGGNLECDGAKLRNADGNALSADGLATTRNVVLSDIESDGAIRLPGARIGGHLTCDGAKLRNAGGDALIASSARVDGALFLRGGASVEGVIDLQAAKLWTICDDPASWPATIFLDRCTYDAFVACPTDAATRIAWLDRDKYPDGFHPQPWEQCAKVLRETGHAVDARAVLIEKEKRQRRARRARASLPWWLALWLWDGLLGITMRYGRRPMLAFAWLALLWLTGAAFFWDAERAGALRPNDGGAIASAAWQRCAGAAPSRLACWQATAAGRDWPDFQPLIYSLDLVLPVVDLQMARWWTPDEAAAWPWATATRRWKWVQIALGWALSLLAVAGFSGLVKSD